MSHRDARGGARARAAALTTTGALLLVLPVLVGFRMAAAGEITYTSGEQDPVIVNPDPGSSATELPEVIDASGGGEPITIEDALTPRSSDVAESRITWLRADGRVIQVPNGGSIDLGDGLQVAVTVAPYPPINFDPATVDFALTWNDQPIEGATMSILYDMRFMEHGPFAIVPDPGGAMGTFTSQYQFFMFGPWQIDAVVVLPGGRSIPFSISIYVWPTT